MKMPAKELREIVIAIGLLPGILHASDTLHPKTFIKEATVFFKGATVTSTSSVDLKKGNTYVLFKGLPYDLEVNSIQVSAPKGVTVRSVSPEKKEQREERKSADEKMLEDRLDSLEVDAKRKQRLKQVLYEEREVMMKNQKIGNKNVNAENVKSMVDFYKERLGIIENEIITIDLELKAGEDEAKEIMESINKLRAQRLAPSTEVLARVHAKEAGKVELRIMYFTNAAGWKPLYDFNVESTKEPVLLRYKADVYQKSGLDWKDVQLKLTTADPTLDTRMPDERIWYIENGRPNQDYNDGSGTGALKGKVLDAETGEPVPFVNVAVKQNGELIAGGATDFDGIYHIKPIPSGSFTVAATSMGMSPVQINGVSIRTSKTQFLDIKMSPNLAMLDAYEVVEYKVPLFEKDQTSSGTTFTREDIRRMPARSAGGVYSRDDGNSNLNIRGSRNDANYYYIDGIKVRGTNYLPQSAIETIQLNSLADKANVNLLEYEIAIPYTILSSHKETQLDLKEVELASDYKFHQYPSIDAYANLVAHIGDWHSLNLFEGPAGIYYKNTYVGKTEVKPYAKNDTLDLVIGRDYNIIAKKLRIKDYTESIQFNNYKKQYIGWEYQVVSRHPNKVQVIIHDQLPKSRSKEVKIEVEETSFAQIDRRGFMKWKKEITNEAPLKLTLKYVIKHPKYMRIEL